MTDRDEGEDAIWINASQLCGQKKWAKRSETGYKVGILKKWGRSSGR